MTRGRWTFTSYFGNTGAEELQVRMSVHEPGWGGGPTVFLDVESVGYLLPFVRLGADGVAALLRLRDDGVLQVQDASSGDALIQPLGDAIPVGILLFWE